MFVAHFGSGDVTALPVRADGSLQDVVSSQRQYGTGPHRRQSSPHAHGVAIAPSRRFVFATDLGADRIFVYRFDRATRSLSPAQPPLESISPGSGPRHVLFDRQGKFLYLNSELTAELRVYRWDERKERLQLVQSLSAYPEGYSGEQKSSSEIAMSRDGRFLYVSLRGDQDSIVVYAVHKRSGSLREMQRISANGKSPWSLAIDPTGRWMVVTNEASNSVSLLGVDPATGLLRATGESVSIPKPVTVAFYRN
jgi:6-phosphogluconolactonase